MSTAMSLDTSLVNIGPLEADSKESVGFYIKNVATMLMQGRVMDSYLNTFEAIARKLYNHVILASKEQKRPYLACFQQDFTALNRSQRQTEEMWELLVEKHVVRHVTPDIFTDLVSSLESLKSLRGDARPRDAAVRIKIYETQINESGLGYNAWFDIVDKLLIKHAKGSTVANYQTNEIGDVISDNNDTVTVMKSDKTESIWDKNDLSGLPSKSLHAYSSMGL